MLQFSSVCVFFVFFSSGDVEDVCDSTESHTSLLRPSSVQHDLWLLAKSPVSHQSQGQPWAHVPRFYRVWAEALLDGLEDEDGGNPKENSAEGI